MKKLTQTLLVSLLSAIALIGLSSCSSGGSSDALHKHKYRDIVTPATCTEQGYTTHTCDCGDSYTDTFTQKLGHQFLSYTYDSNATCTKEGTKSATCNRTGCNETITLSGINSAAHSFNNGICTECEHYDATPYLAFTELSSGTYSVKLSYEDSLPAKIAIPSNYNGKKVTSLGRGSFSGETSLTSVIIPDNIVVIEEMAFEGCTNLTSIVTPDSLIQIQYGAFANCKSLRSIVIPDSVTSISNQVFAYCDSLTSIVIGKNVTKIGSYAFDGCFCLYEVINNSNLTFSFGSEEYGCIAGYAAIIVDTDDIIIPTTSVYFTFCDSSTESL